MNTLAKKASLWLGIVLMSGAVAQAAYITQFDTPPFVLDSTVVGIDGWVAGAGETSSTDTALVVTAPWDSSDTALRLNKGSSSYRPRVKNAITPLSGNVSLSVGMAFNFNPATDTTTATTFAFADQYIGAGPIRFGVSFATGGGLFVVGSGATTIALSKADMKMNSVYVFNLAINIPAQTFDITITGTKADNSPFSYTASAIPSGAFTAIGGVPSLSLLYIETSAKNTFTSYIDSIDISQVPEPNSTALLFGGIFGMALVRVLKGGKGKSARNS